LLLLAEDDYFQLRNEITREYSVLDWLTKIVAKLMENNHRKQSKEITIRRFYSESVEARPETYSVTKQHLAISH
jgi:hypothetical protein